VGARGQEPPAEGSAGNKLIRSAKRYAAVEELMADHGFSEGRACGLIGVNRSAWHYEPLRGQDDAARVRMREIANERRWFGYRRLATPLRRERRGMNLKKVYRLYREERVTVRKRSGLERALGTRPPVAFIPPARAIAHSRAIRFDDSIRPPLAHPQRRPEMRDCLLLHGRCHRFFENRSFRPALFSICHTELRRAP